MYFSVEKVEQVQILFLNSRFLKRRFLNKNQKELTIRLLKIIVILLNHFTHFNLFTLTNSQFLSCLIFQIRKAWYGVIISLCQHAAYLLSDHVKQVCGIVFANLSDKNATVLPTIWDAALELMVAFDVSSSSVLCKSKGMIREICFSICFLSTNVCLSAHHPVQNSIIANLTTFQTRTIGHFYAKRNYVTQEPYAHSCF